MRSPTGLKFFLTMKPRATGGRGVRYARRPRRTLRPYACLRASRELSARVRIMPPTILFRRYAPAARAKLPYLALSSYQLLSQGGPGVRLARHRRGRQALAYATFARSSSKVLKTRPRAKGGRGVRYARTIVNAHHVSQTCMLSPCARLLRIMSPIILPRRYARRPRRTLRSHDRQSASRKPSAHAVA
jgi:hypothetical protein